VEFPVLIFAHNFLLGNFFRLNTFTSLAACFNEESGALSTVTTHDS